MAKCTGITRAGRPCRAHAKLNHKLCSSCQSRFDAATPEDPAYIRGSSRTAYMPKGEFEKAQRLLQQPDIYDLTAEIVTIQVIFCDLEASLHEGDPLDRWRTFSNLLVTMEENWKYALDPAKFPVQFTKFRTAYYQIRALAKACADDRAVRKELVRLGPILGKMQEQQAAIDSKLQEFVPADKIRQLFAGMLTSVYDGIPDEITVEVNGGPVSVPIGHLRENIARSLRAQFSRPELNRSIRTQRVIRRLSHPGEGVNAEQVFESIPEPAAIEAEVVSG